MSRSLNRSLVNDRDPGLRGDEEPLDGAFGTVPAGLISGVGGVAVISLISVFDFDGTQAEEEGAELQGGPREVSEEANSTVNKRNDMFWGKIVTFLASQRRNYGHNFMSPQWKPCVI
ncbi:hypothetical protein PM082_024958 [Marasmius tenuissimus]|nr:hypothetical protein PM082_024958 [Marasmius tenuissimus]